MQVLNLCPRFREMQHSLPADTDTNPAVAHDVCDACLYVNPGDPESTEYVTIPAHCLHRHDIALDTPAQLVGYWHSSCEIPQRLDPC
jgi:hypothetical protein